MCVCVCVCVVLCCVYVCCVVCCVCVCVFVMWVVSVGRTVLGLACAYRCCFVPAFLFCSVFLYSAPGFAFYTYFIIIIKLQMNFFKYSAGMVMYRVR